MFDTVTFECAAPKGYEAEVRALFRELRATVKETRPPRLLAWLLETRFTVTVPADKAELAEAAFRAWFADWRSREAW